MKHLLPIEHKYAIRFRSDSLNILKLTIKIICHRLIRMVQCKIFASFCIIAILDKNLASGKNMSRDYCVHIFFRDRRQSVQPVQRLHQRKGAANGLQHTDGHSSSHALPGAVPLRLALWAFWRLCMAEWGWARPQVSLKSPALSASVISPGLIWLAFQTRPFVRSGFTAGQTQFSETLAA